MFCHALVWIDDQRTYSQQFTHILLTLIVLEGEPSFDSLFLFLKSARNVAPISSLFVYQNSNIRCGTPTLSLSHTHTQMHTHPHPKHTDNPTLTIFCCNLLYC